MAKMTAEELKALPTNPNTSSAIAGKDVLLYIDKGTNTAANWLLIGGQRNSPIKYNADTIDASHKTSDGWGETLAGPKSWSIDFSGLLIEDDAALQILEYAFRNSLDVHVKLAYPDKTYQEGWASITEFDKDFAHDGVATVNVTLSGKGAISEITEEAKTTG